MRLADGLLRTRVAACANDLRLVQIDLADHAQNDRETFLNDVLGRALEDVSSEQQNAFLCAVADHFPLCDESVAEGEPAASTREEAPPTTPDPDALLALLEEAFDGMEADAQARLITRVFEGPVGKAVLSRQASVTSPPPSAAPVPAKPSRRSSDRTATDLPRELIDYVERTDRIVWQAWCEMARDIPKNITPRPGLDLKRDLREASESIGDRLRVSLALFAAFVKSSQRAGNSFANYFHSHYSPTKIEQVLSNKTGGIGALWKAREVRNWECYAAYTEDSRHLSRDAIRRQITATIAQDIGDLMSKVGH